MRKLKILFTLLTLAFVSNYTAAIEIEWSGFGSIVAGKTLGTIDDPLNPGQTRDEILTADFYDVGQYDNDLTFNAESVFALQAVTRLSDELKVTAQLVAKGTDDYEPEFDWLYLTYNVSDEWTLMAGRRNIPMYYYSEFSEVGYAYPWIRPPSNLYWWQVTQFNGFHAMYDFEWGDYSNTLTMFYGNEYSHDNKELAYYADLYRTGASKVDEFWTNIIGANWNISGDNFDIRFVYFENDRERDNFFPDGRVETAAPFSQKFMGVGGTLTFYPLTILFDYNMVKYDDEFKTEFPTYLISLAYSIGDFQPYVSYSKADHERPSIPTEDLEEHYISSIGVRYDVLPNAALKLQYDRFVDQGHAPTVWNYHGDSDTIALGIDFVF